MSSQKLSAFHGSAHTKVQAIQEATNWLEEQSNRDIHDIVTEMFSTTRTFNPEQVIALDNYAAYPTRLGLPRWLASVFGEICSNNSTDGLNSRLTFERSFYIPFLSACRIGADYTHMFHQWELFLLDNYLLNNQKNIPVIKKVIDLHRQALRGSEVSISDWAQANEALEAAMNQIGSMPKSASGVQWDIMRAAYLSTLSFVEEEDDAPTATESMPDVWKHNYLSKYEDANSQKKAEKELWQNVIDRLLKMLQEWN